VKILYGVQGTGNGHTTRARGMARAFAGTGHQVDYLFSGRPENDYFDMQPFAGYRSRTGLTFRHHKGRISSLATLRHTHPFTLVRDICQLDLSGYDVVLNDFEPVSAWAARRQGLPSLALSHQAAFHFDIPRTGEHLVDRLVMKLFAPTQRHLGVHWYHFGQPIVPPLVEPLPAGTVVRNDGFILVYLPFDELPDISRMLQKLSLVRFVVYHPSLSEPDERANICYKPLSREGFQRDLACCDGVIANGGFELPSEAMQLGKKLLLRPLEGQFEQLSNVATLQLMGLAAAMPKLDCNTVHAWLDEEPVGQVHFPAVAPFLACHLEQLMLDDSTALLESLWDQVVFPETVEDQLDELQHGHWPRGTPPHGLWHQVSHSK
jgi:uncharacterized protein (TIGR00661 family)